MGLILIAAVSDFEGKRVIGNKGSIPWFSNDEIRKPDLKRFRALTENHPVIMGRNTFDSLGRKPLENRTNIVITSQKGLFTNSRTLYHASSILEALEIASSFNDTTYIIGGQRVYNQFILMPNAESLEITDIKAKYDGNESFPYIDKNIWQENRREKHELFDFVTYVKSR